MTHKNTCPRVIFGQKLDVKSTVGLVGGGVDVVSSIREDVDSSSRAIRPTKNVFIHLTGAMGSLEAASRSISCRLYRNKKRILNYKFCSENRAK